MTNFAATGHDARVLVTGGAGFIGSHLVERLVARGARVTVVDNLVTGHIENLAAVRGQIELCQEDLLPRLAEPAWLLDFDTIFHLAANPYIPPSVENPSYDYQANLHTTFRLLETLRPAARRPRLINTSSAAVYGNPARLPIREGDPTEPISPYGVSKLAAERYVAVFSQLYGMPAASVRLFSVYGPRQRKQVVFDLLSRLRRDPRALEVIGDGTQERDFAYVGDVVAALLCVAENAPARGEAYNVASGRTHSIGQLVTSLCQVCGVTPEIRYTQSLRPGDAERWVVDMAALHGLGYTAQTTLEQGLTAIRDWYDQHFA